MEPDIITQYEAESYVQSLAIIPIEQYASLQWFRQHECVYKLNLQSHHNARAREDEFVMESLVTWQKINVLIYDLICSEVWKQYILPLVKEQVCNLNSARSYNLIYHEGIVANLLEVSLFHRTACEEAQDNLIDLIDWCYRKLVYLTNYRETDTQQKLRMDKTKEEELDDQINELDFSMGIASLSIIRFITDHLQSLTLAVIQQLVDQCDIFCVLIPLLEMKPWIKQSKQGKLVYLNQQWQPLKDEYQVTGPEAQIWLAVYNLFMNADVRSKYEINSYRKNMLLRLRKFLNEYLIDQIPVLTNLLRALEELSLVGDTTSSRISAFVIQQLPEIKDSIMRGKNWEQIAKQQAETFLVETEETRKADFQLLMSGIDFMMDEPICGNCGVPATQRCSRCKNEWYCSRKCQVSAWKRHKQICHLLKTPEDEVQKIVEV